MTDSDNSVQRRLNRMYRNDYILIAALDHGLSAGVVTGIESLDNLQNVVDSCSSLEIPGLVLNSGVVRKLRLPTHASVIAQLVGMPMCNEHGLPRAVLAYPSTALQSGADAVAVQLTLEPESLSTFSQTIGAITEEAHRLSMPVLLMINNSAWTSANSFLNAVRSFIELDVDIIKMSPGNILYDLPDDSLAATKPPIVMSGGPRRQGFINDVRKARHIGFAGLCFGRNLFERNDVDRRQIVDSIDRVFSDG